MAREIAGTVLREHVALWTAKAKKDHWAHQHDLAWRGGLSSRGMGGALAGLVKAWIAYADAYEVATGGSKIGEDYVIGDDGWTPIGNALLALLNGELGALDGGSLDGLIRDVMIAEGVEVDE